ncbi:protein-methionine sulfoxide oxidase mical2b isoform X2 [Denticeps clupeoides]|uniref:MICAL-like protein 2 n=1 Tax=Denticeps clupeoides TaxID=299321 RepID=A0AAY4C446_9TELE|nr:MICAL-like protein 2 isoform X2 [Denticeps clupeoides]
MAAVKALQQWCRLQCEGYRGVEVTNMTTSFRDGLAFCAILHRHRPDLIHFDSLRKENIYENNHLAFHVAEDQLGIPALLDAEDMVALKVPDRLSILTYVSQYYNYFHGRSPIGGMAGIKRPAESPGDPPSTKKNQPVPANVVTVPSQRAAQSNRGGTMSSSCNACKTHVHLVQRHLVDGKLYHRNCFKCSECSTILLPGTYKPGIKPGTFICTTHQNIPNVRNPASPNQNTSTLSSNQNPKSKLEDLVPKSDQKIRSSPVPAGGSSKPDRQTPPTSTTNNNNATAKPFTISALSQRTAEPTSRVTTPRNQQTTITSSTNKPPAGTSSFQPQTSSSVALKNQQARQRFFQPETGTSTSGTSSRSGVLASVQVDPSPAQRSVGVSAAGGGDRKGRVLLKVGQWGKEEKEEKERAKQVIIKKVLEDKMSGAAALKHAEKRPGAELKDTEKSPAPSGRVQMRPVGACLQPTSSPRANRSPAAFTSNKESRDYSSPSTNSAEREPVPSDWRSLLKPVTKDQKSCGSRDRLEPQSSGPEALKAPPTSARGTTGGSAPAGGANRSAGVKDDVTTTKLAKGNPDRVPAEDIDAELQQIEERLDQLEKEGVELEKKLRACEENREDDLLQNELMVQWFHLIRNKQVYMRRESELVYIAKTQDLEEQQPSVEAELRRLLEKPEHLKTAFDRKKEEELMNRLVGIVNDRNAILEGLDEDRLREEEEDEQLMKMMESLETKKDKDKKKTVKSKLFGRTT